MIPPRPYRAKDFTILKRDGLYHIFYTRTNDAATQGATELSLGHAVSPDLFLWTQLDTVMAVQPGAWDGSHIWAPHIVEVDGVYYLFYTGVLEEPPQYVFYQRVGLATSTDLMTWNRMEVPVFGCTQTPWTLCDSTTFEGGSFRDPFVMRDPANPGHWLLYYGTVPASDPVHMVVGVGGAWGDFAQWSDLGPLWVTSWGVTQRNRAESVHLFDHNDLWFLFFTVDAPDPIVYATGPDPLGEPDTWTYRGALGAMINQNTSYWFASEYFVDGTHEYFCFVNYDRVDVREMVWGPKLRFSLVQPSSFHVQRMDWDVPEAQVGQTVNLLIQATGWWTNAAAIEVTVTDPQGFPHAVSPSEIGLPDEIPLYGPDTLFPWTARGWPDSAGTGAVHIAVRMADHTAASDTLRVVPPGVDFGGGGGVDLMDDYRLRPTLESGPALRMLRETPLGPGPALLVVLPLAGRARVDLFDLQGRRIGNLADREMPAGASVLPWDGQDGRGGRLRPGVYFARLDTPLGQRWTRLALVR